MCLSREEVSSGIGLGRTFLIISTGVCRYDFALISVGSLAAFLLGFWRKCVVERLTRYIDISLALTGLPERAVPSRREGWTARSRLVRIKIRNRQVSRANSGFAGSFLFFPGNLRFVVLAQGQELSLSDRQVIERLCQNTITVIHQGFG